VLLEHRCELANRKAKDLVRSTTSSLPEKQLNVARCASSVKGTAIQGSCTTGFIHLIVHHPSALSSSSVPSVVSIATDLIDDLELALGCAIFPIVESTDGFFVTMSVLLPGPVLQSLVFSKLNF
jgi:hypothetical protein